MATKEDLQALEDRMTAKMADLEGRMATKEELRELETQEGYLLLEEPVPVEISEHGQTVTVELTNHKIPEIPQTGDNSGTAAGACLALSGIAGTVLALSKRRSRRHL